MAPLFQDSGRYNEVHTTPSGPGDARPTATQIIQDNGLTGKLNDKVILLTGGSSGLGIDEVRTLARTGAHVFFTSRDLEKGEAVKNRILDGLTKEGLSFRPRIHVLQMDLASLESVKQGAAEFTSMSHKLNVLVNNAG